MYFSWEYIVPTFKDVFSLDTYLDLKWSDANGFPFLKEHKLLIFIKELLKTRLIKF